MDFVNEKQRLPAIHPTCARCLENLLEIGDTGKDRRNLLKGQPRLAGKQPRNGGLAGAGRAPEDHRSQRPAIDHAAQNALLARQMRLPGHLRQRLRTQAIGKRPPVGDLHGHLRGEKIVAHRRNCRMRCPSRRISTRQKPGLSSSAFSTAAVEPISEPFSDRMTSFGWKPTR
ncbi:hypothetical protein D3C72_1523960 [compost metagenome]